jgi:hypothetical protein
VAGVAANRGFVLLVTVYAPLHLVLMLLDVDVAIHTLELRRVLCVAEEDEIG